MNPSATRSFNDARAGGSKPLNDRPAGPAKVKIAVHGEQGGPAWPRTAVPERHRWQTVEPIAASTGTRDMPSTPKLTTVDTLAISSDTSTCRCGLVSAGK